MARWCPRLQRRWRIWMWLGPASGTGSVEASSTTSTECRHGEPVKAPSIRGRSRRSAAQSLKLGMTMARDSPEFSIPLEISAPLRKAYRPEKSVAGNASGSGQGRVGSKPVGEAQGAQLCSAQRNQQHDGNEDGRK